MLFQYFYKHHIFHILEFPGIFSFLKNYPETIEISRNFLEFFSFPKNYPETIEISRNSGDFIKSRNTGLAIPMEGKLYQNSKKPWALFHKELRSIASCD